MESGMNGLTFYICFGQYGGFKISKDGPSLRLVLGWVAICLLWLDIEMLMGELSDFAGIKPLTAPMPLEEIERQARMGKNWISNVIEIDLSEFIDKDLESILDLMSERLTNTPFLMETNYDIVGRRGNRLYVQVTGDATMVLESLKDRA